MISIRHLHKRYTNQDILKDINLELPSKGIVAIVGPSGCGKTTLLNCISSFLTYDGEIYIDGKSISQFSDNQQSDFRLKTFGFIFQDFKLFEQETLFNNISLPLISSSNASRRRNKQKCQDLIELVGLNGFQKQPVNKLSGGEKQRAAIARALVNDPKVILADEPTGSLDSFNAQEIMKLLEQISKKSLIIIVSHDKTLMEEYADRIIEMNDGSVISDNTYIKTVEHIYLPVGKNTSHLKRASIPLNFLLSHCFHSIKRKKIRNILCSIVTSLGLIGVGLAVCLSSLISTNIKAAYSQIIDESSIIAVRKSDDDVVNHVFAGNYYEATEIAKDYPNHVMDVGVAYDVDFESFFPDCDELLIQSSAYRTSIYGISMRSVNEFKWLDYYHPQIYPHDITELKDDEVVLSLNIKAVRDICYSLRIVKTVESLSEYLDNNELLLYFEAANLSWQYDDQQLVRLKGFVFSNEMGIYHSNHHWNEYMFEERMRFPASDNISEIDYYPWVMKKLYYFHTFGNTDDFLDKCIEDDKLSQYSLEIATTRYYPWMYRNIEIKDRHRVLFFLNTNKSIPTSYQKYFLNNCHNLQEPIFGTREGYAIYPYSMMMGFAHYSYFSSSEDLLFETIDSADNISYYGNEENYLPKGVMSGHYTKTAQNGVKFEIIPNNLLYGRKPRNLDEIVISSSMAKNLFEEYNVTDKVLYCGFSFNERLIDNEHITRDFKTYNLKIVGIVESDKNAIYHRNNWTIRFFQSRLGTSVFDLSVDSIYFPVKDKTQIKQSIDELSLGFPDYLFIDPFEDIDNGVDQVCSIIEVALMAFSIISVVISFLLLSITSFLHVVENYKDFGLARCLGLRNKEARKFLFVRAVVIGGISFILASIQLAIISFVVASMISSSINVSFLYSLNPLAFLYMFLLDVGVSFLSTLIVVGQVNTKSILASLKSI